MTHFQDVFIRNLRYYRKKSGLSQLKFSELAGISPNYLNAVENGKNFPSIAVIQQFLDIFKIMPYELFLEEPLQSKLAGQEHTALLKQDLSHIKNQFDFEIERLIRDYCIAAG